ncbi:unnamed protein product, partial [marine sediment metagenome]
MRNATFLIGLFAVFVAAPAHAILYVDGTSGNDGNAGTALAPVATIQEAVWRCSEPNHAGANRVYVMPGTYNGYMNEVRGCADANNIDNAEHVIVKSYDPTGDEVGYNWANTCINANRDGNAGGKVTALHCHIDLDQVKGWNNEAWKTAF